METTGLIKNEHGEMVNDILVRPVLREMTYKTGDILVAGTIRAKIEDIYYKMTHNCVCVKAEGQPVIAANKLNDLIKAGKIVIEVA
jgi:hypothetical protein